MNPGQSFYPLPQMLIGPGCLESAGDLIMDRFRAKRCLLVTDRGVRAAGLPDGLIASLLASGMTVEVFDEVSADPPEETVTRGAALATRMKADLIIGIGGGSPMDAAKAMAILAGTGRPIAELYGVGQVKGQRLPLVLVPTTGGTGSEATPYAVITRPDGDKVSITDRQSVPDLALLDAELLIGMPAAVTAATGFDAMVHAIEAFTGAKCKNQISDTAARKAFGLLWQALPKSLENPNDLAARGDALIGAMLAGQAIAGAPVGGIHALAYPLGGLHHVAHGLANAILMPHVMRFNLQDEATVDLFADLARDVLTTTRANSDRAWAEALIDHLAAMVGRAPIASRLSECGIGESDLDRLAVEAVGIERLLRNSPLPISREAARKIYGRAL